MLFQVTGEFAPPVPNEIRSPSPRHKDEELQALSPEPSKASRPCCLSSSARFQPASPRAGSPVEAEVERSCQGRLCRRSLPTMTWHVYRTRPVDSDGTEAQTDSHTSALAAGSSRRFAISVLLHLLLLLALSLSFSLSLSLSLSLSPSPPNLTLAGSRVWHHANLQAMLNAQAYKASSTLRSEGSAEP